MQDANSRQIFYSLQKVVSCNGWLYFCTRLRRVKRLAYELVPEMCPVFNTPLNGMDKRVQVWMLWQKGVNSLREPFEVRKLLLETLES